MTRLVETGLVPSSWNANATHGFVTNSMVVIIVRKGNPKHITNWSDLVKPGVQVVTPNPFTSGSARWNIMAAYGAQIKEGKTPRKPRNTSTPSSTTSSARTAPRAAALQTFLAGRGDALLDYEDEAISYTKKGEPIEYAVPPSTILIQNPIAVARQQRDGAELRQLPALARGSGDLGSKRATVP